MKSLVFTLTFLVSRIALFSQNIGIGVSDPMYKLDVGGTFHSSSNAYIDGSLGVGTVSPAYKLQVNDGQIAMYNTIDAKTWFFNYSSSNNYFALTEGGINRLVVLNGGNVGIGTSAPTARLHVAGNVAATGNMTVNGTLTVDEGKGILRNAQGSTQLKYYTREAAFGAVLNGFQLSAEGSFGFANAGFTSPPAVMVGDIVSTGGTVGELYRVQLIIYDCTATGCKARLLNTSPNPVNYGITWNIICIGN